MDFHMPEYKINYEINKSDLYPLLCEKYIEERHFWNEGGPKAHKVLETTVEDPIGSIHVRIYYPNEQPAYHALVFIHGGGFTVGNNDTHDRMMRCIMESSGCAVMNAPK